MSAPQNTAGRQGGRSNKRPNDSPDVKLSKSLSWILRHGAQKENIPIRHDGYICLKVLMSHNKFRNSKITDIARVVKENSKQRYVSRSMCPQIFPNLQNYLDLH